MSWFLAQRPPPLSAAGGISRPNNIGTLQIPVGTDYTDLLVFTQNTLNINMNPLFATGRIQASVSGIFLLHFDIAFINSVNTMFWFTVFKNDDEQIDCSQPGVTTALGGIEPAPFTCPVRLQSGDFAKMRVKADQAGSTLETYVAHFNLTKVGDI
ncbi:MAG: hypothetical protein ACYS1A_16845 [Planctomycetota bacterium]|jgi:hypothetical protein